MKTLPSEHRAAARLLSCYRKGAPHPCIVFLESVRPGPLAATLIFDGKRSLLLVERGGADWEWPSHHCAVSLMRPIASSLPGFASSRISFRLFLAHSHRAEIFLGSSSSWQEARRPGNHLPTVPRGSPQACLRRAYSRFQVSVRPHQHRCHRCISREPRGVPSLLI